MNDELTRRSAIVGLGSISIAALAGCTSDDDGSTASGSSDDGSNGDDDDDSTENGSNGDDENEEDGDEDGSVEILDHEIVEPDVGSYVDVEGTLENNTGEEQSYIEVGVVFRDEDDTRIDDSFTNFSDVEDGETLSFDIMTTVEPDEFDEYELETSTEAF